MALKMRPLLICFIAYVLSLVVTLLALSAAIDLSTATLSTSVPMRAMLMPMIAVFGFWGLCRVFGVPMDPARTFLFGAIAIYGVLFFTGLIISGTGINASLAVFAAALGLFCIAYLAVKHAQQSDEDQL